MAAVTQNTKDLPKDELNNDVFTLSWRLAVQ
jgi:hypothetical protein